MEHAITDSARFGGQLVEALRRDAHNAAVLRFRRRSHIYSAGDAAGSIFMIEAGRVHLLVPALSGRQCLLGIHQAGELFGELCLGSTGQRRQQTAMAVEDTLVRAFPGPRFLECLKRTGLIEHFVHHLAARLAAEERTIASLVTLGAEQRTGEALLRLASAFGEPRREANGATRLAWRLSHEELSQMVGTTRPRVTGFISRFRRLGLLSKTPDGLLLVHEARLQAHLAARGPERAERRPQATTPARGASPVAAARASR